MALFLEVPAWTGFPRPTNVDTGVPPYGGSHRLQTQVTPASAMPSGDPNYDGSGVGDRATPLAADGTTPVLRAAWITMIGP